MPRNRFQDALDIQNACNPSGVAIALSESISTFMKSPEYTGTDSISADPGIRLIAFQLSFLLGVTNGANEFARGPDYYATTRACEVRANA